MSVMIVSAGMAVAGFILALHLPARRSALPEEGDKIQQPSLGLESRTRACKWDMKKCLS
jgi:hypothetical protein